VTSTPLTETPLPRADAARPSAPAEHPAGRKNRRVDAIAATLFISPAMLGFFVFVIVPAIGGLVLAFFEWDLFGTPVFVGLDNITRMFGDPDMWQALWVTLLFVVLGVIQTIFVGFVLAVVVNSNMPGVAGWRVLYFTPMIASAAVAGIIWVNLYSARSGLVNQFLALFGIDGPNWLSDPFWAMPALVIMMIWGGLPIVIILYLAGLQRVPEDIYAAASLDGAGKWRQLWSMTWPNVWSTTLLVAVLQAVGFISGSFEIALIMTDGGPLGTTQSLALYSYKVAFSERDIGYASALSLFQLVLLLVIVVLARAATRLWKARS
jgi:multiple sugar transport system permease protein